VARDFLDHWHDGVQPTTIQAKIFTKGCRLVLEKHDNLEEEFERFRDGSNGWDDCPKMHHLAAAVLPDDFINEGRLYTVMAFATKAHKMEGLTTWLANLLMRCLDIWWWWANIDKHPFTSRQHGD
jgi:hypothetical protein